MTPLHWTLILFALSSSPLARPAVAQVDLVQRAYLKPFNAESSDEFGTSVATFVDTVAVGVPREDGSVGGIDPPDTNGAVFSGAAYVFRDTGSAWVQEAFL